MPVRAHHHGRRPDGVSAPTQYGPGVRGVATYLCGAQHLPVGRAAETLADLLGAAVSEGSVMSWNERAAAGLDLFTAAVRDELAAAPVAHFDESGLRGRPPGLGALRVDPDADFLQVGCNRCQVGHQLGRGDFDPQLAWAEADVGQFDGQSGPDRQIPLNRSTQTRRGRSYVESLDGSRLNAIRAGQLTPNRPAGRR